MYGRPNRRNKAVSSNFSRVVWMGLLIQQKLKYRTSERSYLQVLINAYLQLVVLLLLSVWFALCWCCKKVLHYVAIDGWLAYVKNKFSAVNKWIKKSREKRKVSGEGQTYDLPKNGNLLLF